MVFFIENNAQINTLLTYTKKKQKTSGDTIQSSNAHIAFQGTETLLSGSGDLADLALIFISDVLTMIQEILDQCASPSEF